MKLHLIDDWAFWFWHSATTWGAGVIGGFLAWMASWHGIFFALIPFLPAYLQVPAAILVGALALGGAVGFLRVIKQPKADAKLEKRRAE